MAHVQGGGLLLVLPPAAAAAVQAAAAAAGPEVSAMDLAVRGGGSSFGDIN